MREVKKYMSVAMLLLIYVVAVFLLLRSFYVYQSAYHALSRLIAHPSVEISYETERE